MAHLASWQASIEATIAARLGHALAVIFRYRTAFNGLAIAMTPAEVGLVRGIPGIGSVTADEHLELMTDHGPQWIGADEIWDGSATGVASQGEGVVAAVIDSGVTVGHPSFANVGTDGYEHRNPRGRMYGICAIDARACNDKVIGLYDFTGTGPADELGHGTHVAGTVAGNVVEATIYAPTTAVGPQRLSGVAPHANLISYKVCAPSAFAALGSCPLSGIIAAIDQATADAADVMNLSIGSQSVDPWADPLTLSLLGADAAGVFTAVSAGNSGPGPSTIGRPADAPWVLAVGASTHDRRPTGRVITSGGGSSIGVIVGMSLSSDLTVTPLIDALSVGNPLCNAFTSVQALQIASAVALCVDGGIGRVAKGQNVRDAGGLGMVLAARPEARNSVVADPHVLPTVMIGDPDGVALRTWLATGTGHAVELRGTTLDESSSLADRLAAFSARGPDASNRRVIKPDVIAPGVAIWAAFNAHPGPGPAGDAPYTMLSGTSMSSPYAAGAAALLRAIRPAWTPESIKSALMTTAFVAPRGGRETQPVTNEDHAALANPFDVGAGRIDVARAASAGIVLHETAPHYEAASPNAGGDPAQLNLASVATDDCRTSCGWTRTVTSSASLAVTWTVSMIAGTGFTLNVRPGVFTLAPGETQIVTLTATNTGLTAGVWQFGQVTLTPSANTVPGAQIPVALTIHP
jgi:subtilisin family serine protease